MITEEELAVMRASKGYRDRLAEVSKKKNQTLTALTNEALRRYLEQEEFTFDDVLQLIQKIPALKIYEEKLKQEMQGSPSMICKHLIELIKNKEVFLFEEQDLTSLVERIEKIEKDNVYGIFIHVTSETKGRINEFNESLQKISEMLKGKKISLGAGMKENHHDRILLFVSYLKKESENGAQK